MADHSPSAPVVAGTSTLWDEAVEEARVRVAEYLRVSDAANVNEQIAGYVTQEGRFLLTRTDLLLLTSALDCTPGRRRRPAPKAAFAPTENEQDGSAVRRGTT